MELKLSILTNINISLSDYRAGQSNVIMTISFDTTDQIPPKGIIEQTYPSQFLFQSVTMQGKFLAGYVGNSSSLQYRRIVLQNPHWTFTWQAISLLIGMEVLAWK